MNVIYLLAFLLLGSIPIGVLSVGLDIQSIVGHKNEQIHSHTHFG